MGFGRQLPSCLLTYLRAPSYVKSWSKQLTFCKAEHPAIQVPCAMLSSSNEALLRLRAVPSVCGEPKGMTADDADRPLGQGGALAGPPPPVPSGANVRHQDPRGGEKTFFVCLLLTLIAGISPVNRNL
jgi:hypothetical protein